MLKPLTRQIEAEKDDRQQQDDIAPPWIPAMIVAVIVSCSICRDRGHGHGHTRGRDLEHGAVCMPVVVIAGGAVSMLVRVPMVVMNMAVIVMMIVARLAVVVSMAVIVPCPAMIVATFAVTSTRWGRGLARHQADRHAGEHQTQEKNSGEQHRNMEQISEHQAQGILPIEQDANPAQ